MEGKRIGNAMGRIEAALERIDRTAASLAHARPASGLDAQELRNELAGTLRDLDALIESLER
ncbi:MAG: hypothetical protein C0510_04930 [Erythrobacter sp.]|nr:hypothetical protein [Erythrobacter sp.]